VVLIALATLAVVVAWVLIRRQRLTGFQIVAGCVALFFVRAGGFWLGRYVLANTGGWLQVPAYVLVLLGWPEITVPLMLGWTSNPEHSLIMATGLLAVTSALLGVAVYWRGQHLHRRKAEPRHRP
jgi:hypothetical protein